jgi:hypothetical protein
MLKAIIIAVVGLWLTGNLVFVVWMLIMAKGMEMHERRTMDYDADGLPWCCLLSAGERCINPELDCNDCDVYEEYEEGRHERKECGRLSGPDSDRSNPQSQRRQD